jgi:hypothetical protein
MRPRRIPHAGEAKKLELKLKLMKLVVSISILLL